MSHDPTPEAVTAVRDRERDVLYLLTNPTDGQPLWSIEDLARELEAFDIIDTINSLHRGGLVHRTSDGHVFASRATVCLLRTVGRNI